ALPAIPRSVFKGRVPKGRGIMAKRRAAGRPASPKKTGTRGNKSGNAKRGESPHGPASGLGKLAARAIAWALGEDEHAAGQLELFRRSIARMLDVLRETDSPLDLERIPESNKTALFHLCAARFARLRFRYLPAGDAGRIEALSVTIIGMRSEAAIAAAIREIPEAAAIEGWHRQPGAFASLTSSGEEIRQRLVHARFEMERFNETWNVIMEPIGNSSPDIRVLPIWKRGPGKADDDGLDGVPLSSIYRA